MKHGNAMENPQLKNITDDYRWCSQFKCPFLEDFPTSHLWLQEGSCVAGLFLIDRLGRSPTWQRCFGPCDLCCWATTELLLLYVPNGPDAAQDKLKRYKMLILRLWNGPLRPGSESFCQHSPLLHDFFSPIRLRVNSPLNWVPEVNRILGGRA